MTRDSNHRLTELTWGGTFHIIQSRGFFQTAWGQIYASRWVKNCSCRGRHSSDSSWMWWHSANQSATASLVVGVAHDVGRSQWDVTHQPGLAHCYDLARYKYTVSLIPMHLNKYLSLLSHRLLVLLHGHLIVTRRGVLMSLVLGPFTGSWGISKMVLSNHTPLCEWNWINICSQSSQWVPTLSIWVSGTAP